MRVPIQGVVDLLRGAQVVALSGAGLSTDSGIPDYRGAGARVRQPMTYQELVSGPAAQRRYWARAHLGWARMGSALPNGGHRALAALEGSGVLTGLITQNVDGLHARAGSQRLVDLHGRIADVVCLDCGAHSERDELQRRMEQLNPGWSARALTGALRPDGDVAIDDTDAYVLAGCERCGGRLKPDVVFFGENVPKERVARSTAMVAAADVLLVAGSSLTVMSGLRFVRQAAKAQMPVVIVNRGATRGDDLATLKLDAGCTPALTALAAQLGSQTDTGSSDRALPVGAGRPDAQQ
jgi:NAD-dependent SIR2 family protein deacetylase